MLEQLKEIAHDLGCIHHGLKKDCNQVNCLAINMIMLKVDDLIKLYEIDNYFHNKVNCNLEMTNKYLKLDPIVETVIKKYQKRSKIGIEKYGKTLQENELTLQEWFNHLQEELMDATLYIEKLKGENE